MKLVKLKIRNVRGMPYLEIEPKGKSFVIYGPNGSGKSAVIDALDFLLTGKIARLSGEGTEGVSLKEHGPHIDKVADLINVEVNAEIEVHGISEALIISRKMIKPNLLNYDEKYKEHLTPILELLNRGQYVFTRREVLKLITAKSSTRAQEIQKILKLHEVEEIRTNLVRIVNESIREGKSTREALEKGKRNVLTITGKEEYNENEVLNFINEQRNKLGGEEIFELNSEKLQEGIKGVKVNPNSIDLKGFNERILNLQKEVKSEMLIEVIAADDALRTEITNIKDDELATWNNKRYSFTEQGIELIQDTGECPLCDTPWKEGELRKYLQKRIENESERQKILKNNCKIIFDKASAIVNKLLQVKELLNPVLKSDEANKSEVFQKHIKELQNWTDKLNSLKSVLEKPVEYYTDETFDPEEVKKMYSPANLSYELEQFQKEVKKLFPEATPEQASWDNLTKLVERIKIVEEWQDTFNNSVVYYQRSNALMQAFISARDEILEGLFNKIKDRFIGLYKEMHGEDEKNFSALFTPQEAGLNLNVDFYGRGMHPPHALHSEGHQDSMGVCLFLALSEYLNSGLIDLVLLDDVIMSIDSGHRKAFCSILKKNFPNRQFIITTHDTTWANQLRHEGVVQSKQMLKFFNWNIDTGPMVHYEADVWNRIENDLNNDDINAAAAKLRRGLEEFSRYVCHNLRAAVPYTLGDGGSLGDFMPAAIGQYKKLLKKAKIAAKRWDQQEVFDDLSEIESIAVQIITRTNVEQWAINPAVHYNEWENFSKNDFQPVVEAFKDLCNIVFTCPNPECGAVIRAVYEDSPEPAGVKCNCSTINWNLKDK